jgi:hypothetical protein
MTHRVEGSASIDVNVSPPPGTRVEGKSAGLFKPIAMNRQVQMAHASQGPSTAAGSNLADREECPRPLAQSPLTSAISNTIFVRMVMSVQKPI